MNVKTIRKIKLFIRWKIIQKYKEFLCWGFEHRIMRLSPSSFICNRCNRPCRGKGWKGLTVLNDQYS